MSRGHLIGPGAVVLTHVVAVGAVLGVATGPASSSPVATVIAVTAGKPTEWSFALSRETAPVGTVVFNVTNRGTKPHLFKVCAEPVASSRRNICAGTATPVLAPGKSAKLTVAFEKAGTYEYLCTSAAAKRMKGLITLAAAPGPTTTPKPSTGGSTAPATTAPATPAPSAASGDAAAGLAVFNAVGCAKCHTIGEIKSLGRVEANFNSIHPLPFDTGPITPTQLTDLAAYIASK